MVSLMGPSSPIGRRIRPVDDLLVGIEVDAVIGD